MDRFYKRLEKVNRKIEKNPKKRGYILALIVLATAIGSILFLGVKETGYVVFEEDVVMNTENPFFIEETKTITVEPPIDSPKSLWLSGEVFGNGKAEVYLVTPERMYLVYYFEGEAKEGKTFEDICTETCFNQNLGERAKLYFKLKDTRMRIDKVKYISSRLIEFTLEPKEATVSKEEVEKTIDVTLTNPQQKDFSVYLYVDGPLAQSFSWQGSLIQMTSEDKEKTIPVRVRVPEGLKPGEYPNKITARYVPPGDKEFVGSAPVDEMIITITA